MIHDGQSPIMVNKVWSDPSGKIIGYKIDQNYSSDNALLAIGFENLSYDKEVNVFFSVSTLTKSKNYEDLPSSLDIASEDKLPDEVKKWLIQTEFIQCDHWRINLVASLIKGFNNNLIKTANRITFFTGKIIFYMGGFSQDALSTLRRHFAVCTGKADLGVALLRANGIPARVLMVYPTHYIVEYYAHPYGWIRSETTIGQMPYSNQKYTVAYCAYPEDETSSNIVNGLSPYAGVIAYWGTPNPNVEFGINYSNWKRTLSHNISVSDDYTNSSLFFTKKAWNFYMNYTGADLNLTQKILYDQAILYQETAISCFILNDGIGYVENMQLACDYYDQIE